MPNKEATFFTRVARGAMFSTVAGSVVLMPEDVSPVPVPVMADGDISVVEYTATTEQSTAPDTEEIVSIVMEEQPDEWTPQMEKEFRALALDEAKGELTPQTFRRLEELSWLRNTLQNPRPPEGRGFCSVFLNQLS